MSLLGDRLKSEFDEKQQISEKVNTAHSIPEEIEQEKVNEVILAISKRFSEELSGRDVDDLKEIISNAITEECQKLEISFEEQKRIEKTVMMTALGNGPIEPYLNDPTVTEIVVQRYDNIVIERNGKIEKVDVSFTNDEHLQTIIKRIVQKVGRQVSITNPIVDARLIDGSRINATIPPVSIDGATLTIRKFSDSFLSGKDYLLKGSLNSDMLYFLERCIKGRISLFVSGGTGTGKTTLLNMLSSYIPEGELIITIEDSCELKLQQPNVRRMETRPAANEEMLNVDQKTLVRAALRQRPDRIILGETRDGSIVDIISAMSTGHEGSLTTIHANSPRNLCDVRIPMLYSMNKESNFTDKAIAMHLAEAIQLIVQIKRFPDGSRRITHITHVCGTDENGKVVLKDIFVFDENKVDFTYTGYYPEEIINIVKSKGNSFDTRIFEKGGE